MRKKITVTAVIVLLLIMLIPIKMECDDGGTVVYQAVLYGITERHSLDMEDGKYGYYIGTEVRVLLFDVYDDVEFVPFK